MKKYAFTLLSEGIEKGCGSSRTKISTAYNCFEPDPVAVFRLKRMISSRCNCTFRIPRMFAIKFFNLYLFNGAILMFHERRERAIWESNLHGIGVKWMSRDPWTPSNDCALTRRTNKYNLFNRLTRNAMKFSCYLRSRQFLKRRKLSRDIKLN